jgi:predicted ATPase
VFSGLTAWLLGHPARAVESNHAALTLARELSHQFSLALALHWAAMVHQLRRDVEPTRELAESLVALCTDHGFQQWRAGGTILVGWAQAEQENGGAGIARLCQGIGEYRAMGTKLFVPYYLSLLAAAHLEHGDAAAGLAAAAEAVEVAAGTGERIWDAEIYRLKGELLLALDPVNESQAEIAFRQAIEIGRGQGARGWALRAVTRLSRLLRQQGKRDEARQMLAEIYVWFTEGFDTADLRDAKALLDALSASP